MSLIGKRVKINSLSTANYIVIDKIDSISDKLVITKYLVTNPETQQTFVVEPDTISKILD